MAEGDSTLGWHEVADLLANSGDKQRWSGLRLVDTVFLNSDDGNSSTSRVRSWVFTAKTREITAKKKSSALGAVEKVLERFTQFSLANPLNSERYVGLGSVPGSQAAPVALTKEGLKSFIDEGKACTLQSFLRPRAGENEFIRGWYRNGSVELATISPLYAAEAMPGHTQQAQLPLDASSDQKDSHSVREVTDALQSLAEFLSIQGQGKPSAPLPRKVTELCADFIVDDNSDVWLRSVTDMVCSRAPQLGGPRASEPEPPGLPAVHLRDGVHQLTSHSSALLGLSAWQQVDGRWLLGDLGAAAEGWSDPEAFGELSSQRHMLTGKSILLALECWGLLTGEISTEESRAEAAGLWRDRDAHGQLNLARNDPELYYGEVAVCGNTKEACARLDAIRAGGFGLQDAAHEGDHAEVPQAKNKSDAQSAMVDVTNVQGQDTSLLMNAALNGTVNRSDVAAGNVGDQATEAAGTTVGSPPQELEHERPELEDSGHEVATKVTTTATSAGDDEAAAMSQTEPSLTALGKTLLMGSLDKVNEVYGMRVGKKKMRHQREPNIGLLAKFAVERDRLAREIGFNELSSPASSDVLRSPPTGKKSRAKRAKKSKPKAKGQGQESASPPSRPENVLPLASAKEELLGRLEKEADSRLEALIAPGSDAALPCHPHSSTNFSSTVGGDGGGLSATEAEFQRRMQEMQRAPAPKRRDAPFKQGFEGSVGGSSATLEALRDRIASLEGENEAMKKRVVRVEELRAEEARQKEKAVMKLTQAQVDFNRMMAEKESDWQSKELSLQEELSRAQATKAVDESQYTSSSDQAAHNNRLIDKLSRLEGAMVQQQRKFAEERRTVLSEKNKEVAAAQATGRADLQASRALVAALEDKTSSLQTQLAEAAKQISLFKTRDEESTRRRMAAEDDMVAMRKEVTGLRQAVQQAASLDFDGGEGMTADVKAVVEAAHNRVLYWQESRCIDPISPSLLTGVGVRDGQAAITALTATSEARIRTLNNKVEYLKAQLASEHTLKQELDANLQGAKKKVEEMREEVRDALERADEAHAAALDETQKSMQHQVDSHVNEVFRLQTKVQTLQDQMADALGDVTLSKRQQEASRAEVQQLEAKLELKSADVAKLKQRISELCQQRSRDEDSLASHAGTEAVIRRLDNERQYLKSQLESELTCKGELQEALDKSSRQLGEVKAAWKQELEERNEAHVEATDKLKRDLADSCSEKSSYEAELVSATRQLDLMREGYQKMRDQLRVEQSSLETARTNNRRLADELLAAQQEVKELQHEVKMGSSSHQESLATIQLTIDELEKGKRALALDLGAQLRAQLEKTSAVQQDELRLRKEMNLLQITKQKELAAEKLGQSLRRWKSNRCHYGFGRWMVGGLFASGQEEEQRRLDSVLREAGSKARAHEEEALRYAEALAEQGKEEALKDLERRLRQENNDLQSQAEADTVQRIEEAVSEAELVWERKRRELQSKYESLAHELQAASLSHKNALALLAAEHSEKLEAAVSEARAQSVEDGKKAQLEALEEADNKWRAVLKNEIEKCRADGQALLAQAVREQDAVLAEMQEAFKCEKERLHHLRDESEANAVQHEYDRGTERAEAARGEGVTDGKHIAAKEWVRVREELEHNWEGERQRYETLLTDNKAAFEDELKIRHKQWEEANAMEWSKREEELGQARARAVNIEGEKWKQVLEGAEARSTAQQAASYKKGYDVRTSEAKGEAEKAAGLHENAMLELKQAAKAMADILEKRHREALEKQAAEEEQGRKDAIEECLKLARQEWQVECNDALAKCRALTKAETKAQAQKERQKAVEAARERERLVTERVQEKLRAATTKWASESRELNARAEAAELAEVRAVEEKRSQILLTNQATSRAKQRWEESQRAVMERSATEAIEAQEKALGDARTAFDREKGRAIRDTEQRCREEMQEALELMQEESDRIVGDMETALNQLKEEKEAVQRELLANQQLLRGHEDTIEKLQAAAKSLEFKHTMESWKLIAKAKQKILCLSKVSGEDILKLQKDLERLKDESEQERRLLLSDVDGLLGVVSAATQKRSEMQDTLVHHKREVLIDHKVQTASLHKEMMALAMERETVERNREDVASDTKGLEAQAKEVEKEVHAHSKSSAIGPDGRVSAAHQRKKKRLDEELEGLLERIEGKVAQRLTIEGKLAEIDEARAEKEEEMKTLERALVEVLVEQQKKLLGLLSDAGDDEEALEAIKRRRKAQLIKDRANAGLLD